MPSSPKKTTLDSLIRDLKHKEADVREEAAHQLGEMGPAAKKAVPSLIKLLKDEDCWLPGTAAVALGKIGPSAKKALPQLVVMLSDSSTQLRTTVTEVLAKFGTTALSELKKAFKRGDEDHREAIVNVLGQMTNSSKQTVAMLRGAVKDAHSIVRIAAVEALALKGKTAVDSLVDALEDEHSLVRTKAAQALGALGPAAKKAVRVLKKMDGDRVKEVRSASSKAIQAITADA